ncbi:tail tape measure protein [Sphingomonas pokkalii]|uniref:Tail tape measure protein n=1 Tax=Sphingomonas pokkalii TaxID=2175090 RepID=A0A2U0SC99_9SPHN|nr:tail tape measure protein [Sphingomonas pokkalii]PVX28997.1 tail tape measure protein [Sphingomonas pokkalii]
MDEEIERLMVSVRADTAGFARDVEAMRGSLEGPFEAGVDRAGRSLETTLLRAARTGRIGFDDLRSVAVKAMDEIARAAIGIAIPSLGIGGRSGGLVSLLGGLLGLPGRATGGPVSPGRPYWVGERGPELFVPTSAGQVTPTASGAGRDVRVSITVNAATGEAPQALAQSSRQVARAVRSALAGLD